MSIWRFTSLTILLVVLLIAAAMAGGTELIFGSDPTGLSYGIAGVFGVGMIAAAFNKWGTVAFIRSRLTIMGFIGTALGLLLALTNIDASALQDVEKIPMIFTAAAGGLGTAFATTIVGACGALWLSLLEFLSCEEEW